MRRLYTARELRSLGLTRSAIRWGERKGRWRRVEDGIYADGPEDLTAFDCAVAALLATGGVASGRFAGVLHGLDSVEFRGADFTVPPSASGRRPGARRRELAPERVVVVHGVRCTDGVQALVDLAALHKSARSSGRPKVPCSTPTRDYWHPRVTRRSNPALNRGSRVDPRSYDSVDPHRLTRRSGSTRMRLIPDADVRDC